MARVDLRCACGYMFFVNDLQLSKPEGVRCPSCMAPVGLDGPAPGDGPPRKGVRVLQAEPDRGDSRMKMWIGLAAGGALALVGLLFLAFSGSGRDGDPSKVERLVDRHAVPENPRPRTGGGVAAPLAPPKTPGAVAPSQPIIPITPGTTPAQPPPATTSNPTPVAPPPPSAPAAAGPLPEDVVKGIREDLLALKDWHRNLAISSAEKQRVDALLAAGKGDAGDVEFLRNLQGDPRPRAVREEATLIRETYEKLAKEALEGLPVDKVLTTDGRTLHGKILEETADVVKLERKFSGGVAGVMPLPKATVKELLRGKGLGGEFKTRWDAAKGDAGRLTSLLAWCKENTLPLQASLTAYAILSDDPGRSEARQEAGFTADPVARMLEAEKQGGFITHEGRRWVPRELKDKLIRDGYAVVEGQWVSRKEKMIGVPGLFRYERQDAKPVLISGNGAAASHDVEYVYTPVQEVSTNAWVEKTEMKYLRRFYAPPMDVRQENGWPTVGVPFPQSTPGFALRPLKDVPIVAAGTPMRGETYITIPVGAPILEASVMTAAEVKGTASITVSLIVDGRRERLYTCASKEDKTHKLPDLIRGKTQVDLVAEFSCQATYKSKIERRKVTGPKKNDRGNIIQEGVEVAHARLVPDYPATLFASNSNTIEVFRLTVTSSEPAPGLDRLFEKARDVLK